MQGLNISLIGIVVLFITAGIFYLLMVALQALFPVKNEDDTAEETRVVAETPVTEDNAVIAAIAAVLHLSSTSVINGLGENLSEPRSSWWSARVLNAQKKHLKR